MSDARNFFWYAVTLLSGAWLYRCGGWRLVLGVLLLVGVVGTLTWPSYAAWARRHGIEVQP